MILNKYTIFDTALGAYHQDYSLETEALALRQFADMANEDTQIAKNPEDYTSSDPIKVKVSEVDINPPKDSYGYSSDAVDNRYAYWLKGFSET